MVTLKNKVIEIESINELFHMRNKENEKVIQLVDIFNKLHMRIPQ